METEIPDPNTISVAAADNSDIENTTGVYYGRNSPTTILITNPTQPALESEKDPIPEAEPYYEDDEDYDENNGKA